MRLGITSFLTDKAMAPAALAGAAEERGFTSLYLPEHTHLPVRAATPPGLVDGVSLDDYKASLDPFVALATAASVTTTLRLGTGIVLAAQHDPIVLAKQVATLDHLSGGRVELGIGYGWNREEAADHGLDFDQRRRVAREHLLCMRALWQNDPAEFHGEFVDLDPCWSRPKPLQRRLPVLIGGGAGPKTFAAIAEFADGWLPIGASGLTEALPKLHAAFEAVGRDPGEARVIPFGTIPSAAKLEHLAGLGVSEVVLRLASGSRDAMLADLDALADFVPMAGGLRA